MHHAAIQCSSLTGKCTTHIYNKITYIGYCFSLFFNSFLPYLLVFLFLFLNFLLIYSIYKQENNKCTKKKLKRHKINQTSKWGLELLLYLIYAWVECKTWVTKWIKPWEYIHSLINHIGVCEWAHIFGAFFFHSSFLDVPSSFFHNPKEKRFVYIKKNHMKNVSVYNIHIYWYDKILGSNCSFDINLLRLVIFIFTDTTKVLSSNRKFDINLLNLVIFIFIDTTKVLGSNTILISIYLLLTHLL